MSLKFEQKINLIFLFKLGKDEREAFTMLKTVYEDRCITRSNVNKFFEEFNKNSAAKEQCKVKETDNENVSTRQ